MRYELKFVCEERARPRLLAELRLLQDCLSVAHPPRVVQSIYFDTVDRVALHDNLAGVSRRHKLRFRWYGDASASVPGQLECKRRRGELGDKLVHPLTAPIGVEGNPRHRFVKALRAALPIECRARLDGREPAVWTRYERDYLATQDGEVRVTLDRRFDAFDLRRSKCSKFVWASAPAEAPIPSRLLG